MKINKEKVLNLLCITTLDKELAENILELCGIKPLSDRASEYDGEYVCRFYAKAATFFKKYLPEFYVSELLGINVDKLLKMNIEYMVMPAEMQCLFYDNYPTGKFRYSKYVYNSTQVYKVLDVLSKSLYLRIPLRFAKHFKNSFISEYTAVSALGFTKICPELYHFYLMKLDIRYIIIESKKKYLVDDILNAIEKAEKVFKEYISFNEACELYGFYNMLFLCKEYSPVAYTENFIKYDIVYSDKRYKNAFRDSQSFLNKEYIQKTYLEWFYRRTDEIIPGLKAINYYELKFECAFVKPQFYANNTNDTKLGRNYMPIFGQKSFSFKMLSSYEYDSEYESLALLCKIWGIDGLENNAEFEKVLRRNKVESIFNSSHLYDISEFAKHYEEAAYFNALKSLNIETMDSREYFSSNNKYDLLFIYFKSARITIPNWRSTYIFHNRKKFMKVDVVKFWNKVINNHYKLYKDYILYENQKYISYAKYKRMCLEYFYTYKIFDIYSNNCRAREYMNLDFNCRNSFNYHLHDLINEDYNTAVYVKDLYVAQMSVSFLQNKKESTLTVYETLDKNNEYLPFNKVIMYLNLDKYTITQAWAVLYNLELSIIYYRGDLYIMANEIEKIKNNVTHILMEYIPVENLYYLLHERHPIQKLTEEIVAPPAMFYFIMPENNRGFYFIKKIPLNLLDKVYNESVNCDTLLTAAEVQGNLNMLPSKIPSILAVHLLHIYNGLDKLDQTYSLYTNSSNVYGTRDAVIKLVELQKFHQENYVLEDNIPKFLNINIERLSEKDKEILKTISVYKTPDYIMHLSENKHLTNDRAYRKEDMLNLREFFHVPRNTQYDVKVDNSFSCKVPYQTYTMRLEPLRLKEILERISPTTADIWDRYVRLQLSVQQQSEKGQNYLVNQYIKALNILVNIFQDNEISEICNIQTGTINRSFNTIGSKTYCKILIGFFKYATVEYAEKGIKPKYRIAELKIPSTKKDNPDDILPETYSFREYSNLFNYCNNYYMHIEAAVNEILEHGTCTYASTWFYVMSHLNNAWRSSDFSMFPYIDILDVVYRNTSNDIRWYLNNRITKSEATIIVLRIQSNPKVISKTKKYTRFTCSDELLMTYVTVYSLLVLYTSNYLCYNISFVTHFENKYNGLSKSQLEQFFSRFEMINFRFKSRKLNKTLLSLIDFLENYYIVNDIDTERRQAMLLRSHVTPSTTAHYIQKSKEVFDRLTNMICARGEFGYAYEMMVRSIMDTENKLSLEDMTDKIRRIRYMIPNMKDIDNLYGFLNYTHKEQACINEYINSMSLEELQTTLTKIYLNHLGSKMDKNLPCIKIICNNNHGSKDECTHCIFHIPSIYSLSVICQSIKEDINSYKMAKSEITQKKIISKIFKKSRDIIWAREKYGDDILSEILAINGTDYDQFLIILRSFLNTNTRVEQIVGDKIDA